LYVTNFAKKWIEDVHLTQAFYVISWAPLQLSEQVLDKTCYVGCVALDTGDTAKHYVFTSMIYLL